MKYFVTVCSMVLSLALLASDIHAQSSSSLHARLDDTANVINVYRAGDDTPILTQNARDDFRPYIHPIVAPDGNGILTEYSPGHHKHQTGLYWGFTRVNGRDYFHHPEGDYWRKVSAKVLKAEAAGPHDSVQWQTVYDQLDENGDAILRESQIWTMNERGGQFVLDLQWTGEALTEITIGKYDYGGLFLRMPWKDGIAGQAVNSLRQVNTRADGKRAVWVDVGMAIDGRDDLAHITIFDHARNPGYPHPWRVDRELGIGPCRARLGDWRIAEGEKALIRHQLVVYTGPLDDVALTSQWSNYSQGRTSVQWQIAQQEARAADFLTPGRAVEEMTVQDGFQVNTFAAEPMITQPMAFCWDHRGRMWIAENRDYENRRSGFSNSGDSRILILEDTDRDGVADSRKVFLEGIPFPAAIAVGFDGLWLGAPPNLLFVPDRDRDDKADTDEIEVRLDGWGILDRHETLNSFHWGPDGWLYGCQGFATPSKVGKPVGKGRIYKHKDPFPKKFAFRRVDRVGSSLDETVTGVGRTEINGGVWRYHPIKDRFEVVAHGFSNPWGIDFDAKGQMFITACVIPHLWHVVPGGIYHRQGGSHFSPFVYDDIKTITDHRHRSAHGGARIYMSDAFPDKYRNRIFMANIHEHAVLTDTLEPRGSGFIGHHGDDFLLANNAQWVGFSVEIGPEGAVYVLDWHDADICGKEVLHNETGRVFRMTPEHSRAKDWENRYADLRTLNNFELAQLQTSRSAWHARRARLVLQERSVQGGVDGATHAALRKIFTDDPNADYRLKALWASYVTGGLDADALESTLSDQDPHIRAWAIQLLCEDHSPSKSALAAFTTMAKEDPSPVVRLYLAAALQRIDPDARWPIVAELTRHADDAGDHNIPKMIWFGLEPLVPTNAHRALALATRSRIPLLTRHIARRLSDDEQFAAIIDAVDDASRGQTELLLGMRDGLEGRYDIIAPANWPATADRLRRSGGEPARLALQLSQQFGDAVAAKALLATLRDTNAQISVRREAMEDLVGGRRPELSRLLPALVDEPELRRDSIRAMAAFDDEHFTATLLRQYDQFSREDKLEVVHTLSARSKSGRALTRAIKRGDIPRRDIPAYIARLLRRVVGSGFVEVWGPIDELTADTEGRFAKYRALLTSDAISRADLQEGRVLFNRTCGACHRMYGEGGVIGPEITGANRGNLEYLLGNVLTPSAVIQDDYKMHVVLTDDGRVYSGIPGGENERQLRLRVVNQTEPVVIAKSRIQSREIAPVSMMPQGILETLTDSEVLDLFAYLQSQENSRVP